MIGNKRKILNQDYIISGDWTNTQTGLQVYINHHFLGLVGHISHHHPCFLMYLKSVIVKYS